MKFSCPECGSVVYSQVEEESCPGCQVEMEDVTPEASTSECPISGEGVRLVNGVPACDHFKLENSVGARCAMTESPGSCPSCGLPDYSPRVGVVSG